MSVSVRVALLSLLFSFASLTAQADPYFAQCAHKTGRSANLIIPASVKPTINGQPMAPGSEIAIFTPQGACSGRVMWNEKNVAITIWGNDILTTDKEALDNGDDLIFQVWDAESRKLYVGPELVQIQLDGSKPYYRKESTFAEGAIYRLTALSIDTRLSPALIAPHNGSEISKTSVSLSWARVNGATGYTLQISDNSAFANPVVEREIDDTEASAELTEGAEYFWRVGAQTSNGMSWSETYSFVMGSKSGTEDKELADGFLLDQNYPNPFNPSTTIPFEMVEGGEVSLKIFNLLGQEVAVLVDGYMPAGPHQVQWNAGDLPSGMYVYRLASRKAMQTRTLTLVK